MSSIFLAHSVSLTAKALELKAKLEAAGHKVELPIDPLNLTELSILQGNAFLIGRCDVVFALWSGMSDGCYGDVCMAIALGRRVYVEYPNLHMRRAWALFSELKTIDSWDVRREV
jgi:hypothetical protein